MRCVLLSPCEGRAAGCRLVGVVAGWQSHMLHASWGVCIQAVAHKAKVHTSHKASRAAGHTHASMHYSPASQLLVCFKLSRGSGAAAATTVFTSLTHTVVEQDCLTQVEDGRVIFSMMLPSAALMDVHADSSARCVWDSSLHTPWTAAPSNSLCTRST